MPSEVLTQALAAAKPSESETLQLTNTPSSHQPGTFRRKNTQNRRNSCIWCAAYTQSICACVSVCSSRKLQLVVQHRRTSSRGDTSMGRLYGWSVHCCCGRKTVRTCIAGNEATSVSLVVVVSSEQEQAVIRACGSCWSSLCDFRAGTAHCLGGNVARICQCEK
jgi:hypothetical protein